MNPWQTWLQTWAQQQSATGGTPSLAQWQKACQQWQSSCESAWAAPAAYWQTVSAIQSARARSISEFWQQQPQHLATLFQCTTFPQWLECATRWHGHNLTSAINLCTVTQAHRGNLWLQWQRQLPFLSATPAGLNNMWNSTGPFSGNGSWPAAQPQTATAKPAVTPAPQPQYTPAPTTHPTQSETAAAPQPTKPPVQQQAPAPQPKPATQPQAAAPQPAPKPVQQPAPTPIVAAPATSHTSLTRPETPAPATTPNQLALINGSGTGNLAVVSSTANSVMRNAAGSTIAAAAARRSVVARRASGNRRRAPR